MILSERITTFRFSDRAGYVPGIGAAVGSGRIAWGVVRVSFNGIALGYTKIRKRDSSKRIEAIQDGGKSIGRGCLEICCLGISLRKYDNNKKIYRLETGLYCDKKMNFSYKGEVIKGKFEGEGTLNYLKGKKSGVEYNGNFSNGVYEGTGTLYFPDESRYQGLFSKGLYHGRGSFYDSLGNAVEGEFIEGEFPKKGIQRMKSGRLYIGGLKKNMRDGKGEIIHSDGTISKGRWKNGKREHAKKSRK